MKIACFLPNLGGGGAERVMIASIRDLIRRNHDVDLLVMSDDGDLMPLLPKAVRIINFGSKNIRGTLLPLIRYLRRNRPDALHAQMWPITIIALIARQLSRTKCRLVVSDQVALTSYASSFVERFMIRWTIRLFYPWAEARVMCSESAAKEISEHSGLSRSSFQIITNPIEPPEYIATTDDVEALWGAAEGRIITIGTLKAQKNHSLLIEAFAKTKVRPRSKLLILGEGSLRPFLTEQAIRLGVSERVLMPGFDINPWPYLASADVFVLSSNYEGFPLVLAEALYAGLSIISTDCTSGPREITDHGRYGILVPCNDVTAMADAIDRVWSTQRDRSELRSRAQEIAGAKQISAYSDLLITG